MSDYGILVFGNFVLPACSTGAACVKPLDELGRAGAAAPGYAPTPAPHHIYLVEAVKPTKSNLEGGDSNDSPPPAFTLATRRRTTVYGCGSVDVTVVAASGDLAIRVTLTGAD